MDDMELYRVLGQNVARLRKAKELTQAEVATAIGLTRASLANIETGRQKVLLHHVFMLANALECASILDLIPKSFTFAGEDQPVTVHGSPLSEQQHAQVGRFFRTAGTR
jgi:transcriptional regulator with XRE-family HTH domain